MSIIVKDMEMPKEPDEMIELAIFGDGKTLKTGESWRSPVDGKCYYGPSEDMNTYFAEELSKPQWISVTERLPKINSDMYSDDLIVCMRRFDGEDYYYEKFAGYLTSGNIWYTYQHDSCSQVGIEHHMKHCRGTADVIVAWMPMPSLPEPPKEET